MATYQAVGLASASVRPDHQQRAVAATCIKHGLRELCESGYGVALVLGHSSCYPRFGFVTESAHGIQWGHQVLVVKRDDRVLPELCALRIRVVEVVAPIRVRRNTRLGGHYQIDALPPRVVEAFGVFLDALLFMNTGLI